MVTYKIIEELRKRAGGVRIEEMKVGPLFFVDDGMLLTRGREEAKRTVRILKEEAGKFGLEINMMKSECMIFNVNRIEGKQRNRR